jgi:hypothetical protein
LDRLIAVRQKSAVEAYRRALEPCSGLEDRIPLSRACARKRATWTFNLQRHLVSRSTLRIFRSEAVAQWRSATNAA